MTEPIASHLDQVDKSTANDAALLALLHELKERHYHFVTPTPATHARIVARPSRRQARNLRDVLGWSLPFDSQVLDPALFDLLLAADALDELDDGRLISRYRVSCLAGVFFLHSAYPTEAADSVFFGPDSYRFAALIQSELGRYPPPLEGRLVDIGAGAGVGAIIAAQLCPNLHITMTDVNAAALRLARINALNTGISAVFALGADLDPVDGPVDLALANPPYLLDAAGRDYRNGGDMHGGRVAYKMAIAALNQLSPNGRLILYTGSAIIDGEDRLRTALTTLALERGCTIRYWEIDPDMFGEELSQPQYTDVERIAIVGAVITRVN